VGSPQNSDERSCQPRRCLRGLRIAIEEAIPVGKMAHAKDAWAANDELRAAGKALMEGYESLAQRPHKLAPKVAQQLGTLGGGNHLIEVCLDTAGGVWLMLHSGSRHIGAVLAEQHMEVAKRLGHNQALEDPNPAVFLAGTKAFQAYRRYLLWAQDYAGFNRRLMVHLLCGVMRRS
jgi:tRNA-splicing ligase RtcB